MTTSCGNNLSRLIVFVFAFAINSMIEFWFVNVIISTAKSIKVAFILLCRKRTSSIPFS